jgi:hypothetical protein
VSEALNGDVFWERLAFRLLHPVQGEILEAMAWIGMPMSAVDLVKVLCEEISLPTVAYHVRRLAEIDALELTEERHIRGALKRSYRFVLQPRSNGT